MVKLYDEGIYLVNGTEIVPESEGAKVQALTGKAADKEDSKERHYGLFYFKCPQHFRGHGAFKA